MLDSIAFDDTYSIFGVSHLQTAFCLLMLGYALAFACFVTEIMWHLNRSELWEPLGTPLCHSRHR